MSFGIQRFHLGALPLRVVLVNVRGEGVFGLVRGVAGGTAKTLGRPGPVAVRKVPL
jgi:hypothetical protein